MSHTIQNKHRRKSMGAKTSSDYFHLQKFEKMSISKRCLQKILYLDKNAFNIFVLRQRHLQLHFPSKKTKRSVNNHEKFNVRGSGDVKYSNFSFTLYVAVLHNLQ